MIYNQSSSRNKIRRKTSSIWI